MQKLRGPSVLSYVKICRRICDACVMLVVAGSACCGLSCGLMHIKYIPSIYYLYIPHVFYFIGRVIASYIHLIYFLKVYSYKINRLLLLI